jgi:hypothetical protein
MSDEPEVQPDSPATEVAPAEETEVSPCLAERLAAAGDLPPELLAFLVRSVPPRALWAWLNKPDQARLLQLSTRGFQRNAGALRQPNVRKRLEAHLQKTSDDVAQLIELWAESKPESLEAVSATSSEELQDALPALWRRFGGEALFLSLLAANCDDASLEAYLALDAEGVGEEEMENSASTVESDSTSDTEPLLPPRDIEAELEAARTEAQNARVEAQSMLERAQRSSRELSAMRAHSSREVQNAQAAEKKAERRAIAAETELAETKKLLDRTARRQRHVEAERDELAIDAKRTKKQLRQAQQIQEDLRKQIASLHAKLEQLAPADSPRETKPTPPAEAPKSAAPTPADALFEWVSDGRRFQVSPRDVARAIVRNDEDFVFHLIQAFDSMKEQSEEYFRLFLRRVRELDYYFERVLTKETTRVLIDASNVVRYDTEHKGRGRLKDLLQMRDELRRRDCFPISIIADASLRYFIDKPNELMAMANRGEIIIADKGVEADELLAREARRSGAYVVTNDRGFHTKVSPDFEPPRITFRIIDGFLIVDDF